MITTERSYFYVVFAFIIGAVALATFSLASNAEAHTGANLKKHKHATTTSANLTCVQEAVTDRETAILAAYDKHFTTIKTALEERKAALIGAWGKTDAKERRAAIKNAWKEFRSEKSASHKTLGKERKAAWKEFRDTVKNECKEQVPAEEGESNDTIV